MQHSMLVDEGDPPQKLEHKRLPRGGEGIGMAALDMTRQPSRTLHQPHAMQTLQSGARACHGGAAVCVRACV